MRREGNIVNFLRYRRLGIEKKAFFNRIVILSRPPCDMPYEDFYS